MNTEDQVTNTAAIVNPDLLDIKIAVGITRGQQTIDVITLRKPKTHALRGLNLSDVLNANVNALIKLLPRITQPALSEDEVANLDLADFTKVSTGLIGFFVDTNDQSQNL
jgi:hypothetical protein